MGMFSWKCKGCGGELVSAELVRIAGFVGIYDGYGRVDGIDGGEFDTNGSDLPCWHEKCYQDATDQEKLDTTKSDYADNQGCGWPKDEFLPEHEITHYIIKGDLTVVVGDYENVRFPQRNYNEDGEFIDTAIDTPGDSTPKKFNTPEEAIEASKDAIKKAERVTVLACGADGCGMILSRENKELIKKARQEIDKYCAKNKKRDAA